MDAPPSPSGSETPFLPAPGGGAPDRFVRVRMYNVGFGDAFLLFLPTSDGEKKVLIDCGSLAQSEQGASLDEVVAAIVEAVTDNKDGVRRPRIDVVVATHRHRDHVSGFDRALWNEVEVKEVWMPWTEHPTETDARLVREAQIRLAVQVDHELNLLGAVKLDTLAPGLPLREIASLALANEAAMHTLHHGFRPPAPKRRYLGATASHLNVETEALPGILVHLLGPSREQRVIRNLNPPVGESYLRMAGAGGSGPGAPYPFDRGWSYPPEEFVTEFKHLALAEDVRDQVIQLSQEMIPTTVLALDQAINGTSLMLMFQIGQTHLLFPGDAQWGTWQMLLEDPERKELLRRTTFYKVGHHGSHNATPRQFVEEVLSNAYWGGMVSVCETTRWAEIPKKELLEQLRKSPRRIVRSDELQAALPEGFHSQGELYVEARIPI